MAKKIITPRIERICSEMDELHKSNERLSNRLDRRERERRRLGSCECWRNLVFCLGVATGSLPCVLAKTFGIQWNIAMMSGMVLFFASMLVVPLLFTMIDGFQDLNRPDQIRKYAICESARASAAWGMWEAGDLPVIKRLAEIGWELHEFYGGRLGYSEPLFLSELAKHFEHRLRNERLGNPVHFEI